MVKAAEQHPASDIGSALFVTPTINMVRLAI
jgi:hypothetical protein